MALTSKTIRVSTANASVEIQGWGKGSPRLRVELNVPVGRLYMEDDMASNFIAAIDDALDSMGLRVQKEGGEK